MVSDSNKSYSIVIGFKELCNNVITLTLLSYRRKIRRLKVTKKSLGDEIFNRRIF